MAESSDLVELYDEFMAGNEAAGELLLAKLHERLVRHARRCKGPHLKGRVHSEEVAQSALASFLRGARQGRFSFEHSWALWRLIFTILENKIRRAARLVDNTLQSSPESPSPVPPPGGPVVLEDLIEAVLKGVPERCAKLLQYRLEDRTITDIAELLEVSRWTVRRDLIRLEHRLESVIGISSVRHGRAPIPV